MTHVSAWPTDVVRLVFASLDPLDRCNFADAWPVHAHLITRADREMCLLEHAFRAGTLQPTEPVLAVMERRLEHATTIKLLESPTLHGDWVTVLRVKLCMSQGGDCDVCVSYLGHDCKKAILKHLSTLSIREFDAFALTTCFDGLCERPYLWDDFFRSCARDSLLHAVLSFTGPRGAIVLENISDIMARLTAWYLPHSLPPAVGSSCLQHCVNAGLLEIAHALRKAGHRIVSK